ncbi:MAG: pyruvate kinase, partial [Patescibacteria group bacterium]
NHKKLISNVRKVGLKTGQPVAVMQDLQGPKIRVGILPDSGVELRSGEEVIFDTAVKKYAAGAIPLDFAELHKHVKKGERMLLDDGRIETKISGVAGTKIKAMILNSGRIFSHKGINTPDSDVDISCLTEKDKIDLKFGISQNVDFVALSFVRRAQDILDLRFLIVEYEKQLKIKPVEPIRIIAKIERSEAVRNIDEILDAVDGIMVARGDLGIEIPAAEVPMTQKKLVEKALKAAKPVIVATQMLDSMQTNPRPTRAEVSDVANAVIDHTDAVMLSNETATGKYPVEAARMMTEIILETEKSAYDDLLLTENVGNKGPLDSVISEMSRILAQKINAKLILAASLTGETGRHISRYRPQMPIIVATATDRVCQQLNLSWGIRPFVLVPCRSIEELVERSLTYLKKNKFVATGDKIIVVAGEPVGQAGNV